MGNEYLMDKIEERYGEQLTFGAIAQSFSNMNKDIEYQNQIEELYLDILKDDVIEKEIEVNNVYKKAQMNSPICEICREYIVEQAKKNNNKLKKKEEVVLFQCRHVYHRKCIYKD